MTTLLVVFFAIAVVVTLVGLLLSSSKPSQPPAQRGMSYVAREGNLRQAYNGKNLRTRRMVAEYEAEGRASEWLNLASLLNVKSLFESGARKQTPWLGILCILIAVFTIGLLSMRTLFPGVSLMMAPPSLNAPAAPALASAKPAVDPAALLLANVSGASKALERLGQLDAAQYASSAEYDKWAYSACSAAAMTELINAYGHHYRITDILNVEARIGEITPELGLLEATGIDHTVAQFGFKTIPLADKSLDNLIAIANHGHPVIISFPPSHWPGGHILILRGGDANQVFLADSSKLDWTVVTREKFMNFWGGFATVAVPQNM